MESVGWLGSPGNVNCHLHPLMSFDSLIGIHQITGYEDVLEDTIENA